MSVKIRRNKITLTRGDTARIKISLSDINGNPYLPVEGDSVKFAVRRKAEDESELFSIDVPIDTCELHIKPIDTKELEFGEYKYDIQITLNNGDVYTPEQFNYQPFVLIKEVAD